MSPIQENETRRVGRRMLIAAPVILTAGAAAAYCSTEPAPPGSKRGYKSTPTSNALVVTTVLATVASFVVGGRLSDRRTPNPAPQPSP